MPAYPGVCSRPISAAEVITSSETLKNSSCAVKMLSELLSFLMKAPENTELRAPGRESITGSIPPEVMATLVLFSSIDLRYSLLKTALDCLLAAEFPDLKTTPE